MTRIWPLLFFGFYCCVHEVGGNCSVKGHEINEGKMWILQTYFNVTCNNSRIEVSSLWRSLSSLFRFLIVSPIRVPKFLWERLTSRNKALITPAKEMPYLDMPPHSWNSLRLSRRPKSASKAMMTIWGPDLWYPVSGMRSSAARTLSEIWWRRDFMWQIEWVWDTVMSTRTREEGKSKEEVFSRNSLIKHAFRLNCRFEYLN